MTYLKYSNKTEAASQFTKSVFVIIMNFYNIPFLKLNTKLQSQCNYNSSNCYMIRSLIEFKNK